MTLIVSKVVTESIASQAPPKYTCYVAKCKTLNGQNLCFAEAYESSTPCPEGHQTPSEVCAGNGPCGPIKSSVPPTSISPPKIF